MTTVKRCPRCRRVKPASQFYRRRGGQQLSSYCQPCAKAAAREARSHRRHDPAAVVRLRAVDRARQHRQRSMGRQGGASQ